jgi:N-acetylglucosamine malate deacetylase 2
VSGQDAGTPGGGRPAAGGKRRAGGGARAAGGGAGGRARRLLPPWRNVLAVVAHPDDETFGLGAVIARLTASGTAVHLLCFTRGEASTVNETSADLARERETELRQASAELAVSSVTLLDYPDGGLAGVPPAELAGHVSQLAGHVTQLADRGQADGMLVFDDNGVTGHPDHRAATGAALRAAAGLGLPVLAWTLPATVAGRLRAETGQPFTGQLPDDIDLCVRVDRARQRRAALMHVTQAAPTSVLWRRLQLQADCEHLRWLMPPR